MYYQIAPQLRHQDCGRLRVRRIPHVEQPHQKLEFSVCPQAWRNINPHSYGRIGIKIKIQFNTI